MRGFEGAQQDQSLSQWILLSQDIQESPLRGSLAPKGDASPGIMAYPLILLKKKKKKHFCLLEEPMFKYSHTINQDLYQFSIPYDERDFLGLIYQSILMEGEKNKF